jgi:folylpolyglutamate synthase
VNAALALGLVKEWLRKLRSSIPVGTTIEGMDKLSDSESFLAGLAHAQWPGRCQTFKSADYPQTTFYMDGAHTPESLDVKYDPNQRSVLNGLLLYLIRAKPRL